MTAGRGNSGNARAEPRRGAPMVNGVPVHPHEIEPGRSVPADWNKHLFEPWADRKARLAAEWAARQQRIQP